MIFTDETSKEGVFEDNVFKYKLEKDMNNHN